MKRLPRRSTAFLGAISCALLSTTTGHSQCIPRPADLVLWYTLDETSVSPGVTDLVNGYVSPLVANPLSSNPGVTNVALVQGVRGGAMFFDGSSNPIIPTSGAVGYFLAHDSTPTDFGTTQDFSIDFYILDMGCDQRARATGARTPCTNVWMGTTAAGQGWELGSHWNLSSLYLNLLNAGAAFPLAQFYIPPFTWVHVTITVDRTGPVEVYLDGTLAASFIAPSNTINLSTFRPVVIGGTYDGTSGGPLPVALARGYLDEVEIFHRVLTPGEVMDIASPTKGKCKPLPATAKGMTWERRSVNATNGTVTVGCTGGANVCNPNTGDTLCSTSLPVLCFKPSSFPIPASVISSTYNRWSGGIVGTTAAVAASSFGGSLANAELKCVQEFGVGWRVAEFHDGWGWNFQAYGNVGTLSNRFWVHINDRPNARCWN
jgi:concanavalin A-like lectin/glucanase superfamily protein